MAITAATLTYDGTLIGDQITSSPWASVAVIFPDSGSVPNKPQFMLEVLQPPNVDGSRYRVGGAHYPQFHLVTVVPAADFSDATTIARQMEMCRGEYLNIDIPLLGTSSRCAVLDVKAVASAKRVIGASANFLPNGDLLSGGNTNSLASVDTMWTLQVASP